MLLTQLRGGFTVSGSYGSGIVLARLGEGRGWSAPASISTWGVGFGPHCGYRKVDVVLALSNESSNPHSHPRPGCLIWQVDAVLVLSNESSLRAYSGASSFALGLDASVAAGPLGRDIGASARFGRGDGEVVDETGTTGLSANFYYSHSQVGATVHLRVPYGSCLARLYYYSCHCLLRPLAGRVRRLVCDGGAGQGSAGPERGVLWHRGRDHRPDPLWGGVNIVRVARIRMHASTRSSLGRCRGLSQVAVGNIGKLLICSPGAEAFG